MKLTENQITTIVYDNENKGERTTRVVIPTSVPKDVIRAIDVDSLDPAERTAMLEMYNQYREYTQQYIATMFKFEDWVEHTKGHEIKPKWRAFKVSGLKS